VGASFAAYLDGSMNARTLRRALIWISGGGLLVAMAVDALAMLGRQVRIPLLGSIEIVEGAVLVAAAGALIIATMDNTHARVNLVSARLPGPVRKWLEKFHALAGVLLFSALLAGTVWIAADLWFGHEESELLHIPYRPLRIATAISLAALLIFSLRRLLGRDAQ
jgi:TRAP-type C4-dicarboxylate transport system permease small subunit